MKSITTKQVQKIEQFLSADNIISKIEELEHQLEKVEIINKQLIGKLELQKFEVEGAKSSKNTFKSLLDNTAPFIIIDNQQNIQDISTSAKKLTGHVKKNRTIAEIFEFEDIDLFNFYFSKALKGKKIPGDVIGFNIADRGQKYAIKLQTIKIGFLVILFLEDSPEVNKKGENRINVLERFTDAMFVINDAFKFVHINEQAAELFQKDKNELLEKVIWNEFSVSKSTQFYKQFHTAFENKVDIHFEELFEHTGQWFEVHGCMTSNGLLVYLRCISKRKNIEKKLQDKNEELLKINHELDNFVYRAAHDLRGPLASVLGLINITKIEDSADKKVEYLDKMTGCINNLESVFDNIVHYSRNSSLFVQSDEINFDLLFDEIFSQLHYIKGADNVTRNLVIKQNAPFHSDQSRIKDALQNIIINAIHYQKTNIANPFVKINITTDYEKVRIIIEDNGNGIPKEHVSRIFNMFYRASEQSNGSGLGLYVVHEIIKKLGGTIKVKSQLKIGTTFTIDIPNGR